MGSANMKGRHRAHGSIWRGLLWAAAVAAAITALYCINSMAMHRVGLAIEIGTSTPPGWSDVKRHSSSQLEKDTRELLEAHHGLQTIHTAAASDLHDDGVEAVLAISAANDIHRVRSMFASVQHYQPHAKRVLCLFGNRGEIDPLKESFDVVTLEDLNINNMHRPLFWYSVVEGSTFIKPECMRHMFTKKGVQRLIYFDNDILLFKSVDSIYNKLKAHSFVLTPHMTEPLPNDGKHPQDIHVLASGTYNLGFLGISKTTTALKMLDWWNDKLFAQAFNAVQRGMMTDQRWADYIPSMFGDAYIERTPGYDTAWWNLHYNGKRIVFTDKDHVTIGSHPLVFYHFSGFDYQKPEVLSKHQTRFKFADLPNIVPMYNYYSEQLRSFDTRTPDEHKPPFAQFDNGLVIPDFVRPWYATLSASQLDSLGNPFATSLSTNNGTAVLLDFLLENYCPSATHYMPQVLAMAYGSRPDLQRVFPHLCGDQNQQFLGWFYQHGAQQVHAMDQQMRSWIAARQRLVGRVHIPQPLSAVVVGFLTGEFGVAESARLTARALQDAQITTKILPLVAPMHGNHDMTLSGYGRATEPLGFNIFHVNADSMAATMRTPSVVRMVQGGPTGKRAINVVVWFWELSQFPIKRFARCTEHVDEIWVATQFIERAIAAVSPVPVYQIDFPAPQLAPSPTGAPTFDMRAKWDLKDRFVFFFNFDYLSCLRRKNPDKVLAAFLAAFGASKAGTGPALVLKSINSKYSYESRKHWAEMQASVPPGASVHFVDQLLSHNDMDAALSTIDCYVSLHRAEGLGLGMLQAMQLRKPVIGTGYSGNMDFMRPDNSYLVNYSLVPVGVPWGPYEANASWAEPNVTHAASLMQHVYGNQAEAALKGLAASEYISKRYSSARSGELIKRRLEYLRKLAMGA